MLFYSLQILLRFSSWLIIFKPHLKEIPKISKLICYFCWVYWLVKIIWFLYIRLKEFLLSFIFKTKNKFWIDLFKCLSTRHNSWQLALGFIINTLFLSKSITSSSSNTSYKRNSAEDIAYPENLHRVDSKKRRKSKRV